MFSHGAVAGQKIINLLGKLGGKDRQYNVLNGVTDISAELQYWLTVLSQSKDGVTGGILMLEPGTYRVGTADTVTMPSGVTLDMNGGELSIDSGVTVTVNGTLDLTHGKVSGAGALTFASGSSAVLPETRQCFDISGGLTVTFSQWVAHRISVAAFGAKPDNSTSGATNSAAFAAAIASLPSANEIPVLMLQPGRYKVAGDPAVNINKPLRLEGNHAILDYETGTGTCLQIGDVLGSSIGDVWVEDIKITRSYTVSGAAADQLKGTGILLQNLKNSIFIRPEVSGYKYGMKFWGNQQGTAYIEVHYPIITPNLIGMHFDSSDHNDSFCSEIRIRGGRVSYNTGFTDNSGSRLVQVAATNSFHRQHLITFFGTNLENTTERKIDVDAEEIGFFQCGYDPGSYTGNFPYKATLTGVSSTGGSAVLTKTGHGLSIVDGDVVLITSATNASDKGWYIVQSSDANTITLDKQLYGTQADVALTLYRANFHFHSGSRENVIVGGSVLNENVISDESGNNLVIDGQLGLARGLAHPPVADEEYSPTSRYGLLAASYAYSSGIYAHLDNLYDHATSGDVGLEFGAADAYGHRRGFARIAADKSGRDNRSVQGALRFYAVSRPGDTLSNAPSARLALNANSDGADLVGQADSAGNWRGQLYNWIYQASIGDDATQAMPSGHSGWVIGTCNGESGIWVIFSSGGATTVTKVAGTTNTADTDSDTNFCVYASGDQAIVKNRLGTAADVRVEFKYN